MGAENAGTAEENASQETYTAGDRIERAIPLQPLQPVQPFRSSQEVQPVVVQQQGNYEIQETSASANINIEEGLSGNPVSPNRHDEQQTQNEGMVEPLRFILTKI